MCRHLELKAQRVQVEIKGNALYAKSRLTSRLASKLKRKFSKKEDGEVKPNQNKGPNAPNKTNKNTTSVERPRQITWPGSNALNAMNSAISLRIVPIETKYILHPCHYLRFVVRP